LRLFSATPPATPARAAPPASSGAFAFDASSTTFPPVLAIGPFDDVCRAPAPEDVRREADVVLRRDREDAELPLFERVRPELDRALLDEPEEPFLLVDFFVLEPLDELLLEDRVVCAIFIASLGFRASCAFRAGCSVGLPAAVKFELPCQEVKFDCRPKSSV
jgi:hypothetical protein